MTTGLPRPSVGDVVLTSVLLVLGQLTTWLTLDTPDSFAGPRVVNAVVVALGVLPLLWRRFAPVTVVAVSASILCLPNAVLDLDVTVLGHFLVVVVVTASCGYHAPPRRAVLGALLALACTLALTAATPFLRSPSSIVYNSVVLLAPWAAARALRHREERARRLGAELEQERARFQGRLAQAVDRERTSIAHDLHDVVAHAVSVMVVQIGGARLQLAGDADLASRSLLQAEDAGRQALVDLRRMLGVLREGPATTADAGPRPGLRELPALVERAGAAGLQVRATITGDLGRLPPAVDLSAYRIAQEAVTNVLKHSHATEADLRLDASAAQVLISVQDPGPPRAGGEVSGFGLVGVRERASFLGGDAQIGPRTDGGWRVAVSIPLVEGRTRAMMTEETPA